MPWNPETGTWTILPSGQRIRQEIPAWDLSVGDILAEQGLLEAAQSPVGKARAKLMREMELIAERPAPGRGPSPLVRPESIYENILRAGAAETIANPGQNDIRALLAMAQR